jgi:hypothetical protein
VYSNIWEGNGTGWFDDVILVINGTSENLIKDSGFENNIRGNKTDYEFDGIYLDSIGTGDKWRCTKWAKIENYRREHWKYTDYPLVFSFEPVLLHMFSTYEYIDSVSSHMHSHNKYVWGNIFGGYDKYAHLLDVTGSEIWSEEPDWQSSYRRTMSHQKTIVNLLAGPNHIDTHEEMEKYINAEMFYGNFPSVVSAGTTPFWSNHTYEDYRDLFKKYIPIIRTISSAGWEPIPYARCDNPDMKFERYGNIDEGLYFTVGNNGSGVESGVLSVDLPKLGFDGTQVEVRELVANTTSMQDVQDGKLSLAITSLHQNDTRVYRIVP